MNHLLRVVVLAFSAVLVIFGAYRLLRGTALKPADPTVDYFAGRLAFDPASPVAWSDLAEASFRAGDIARARACFRRALELGPRMPAILVRAGNFHFMLSESDETLALARQVLAQVPDYDGALFQQLDRLELPPGRVVETLAKDRRAAVSYFDHLLANGALEPAAEGWSALSRHGLADDRTASQYVRLLLDRRQPAAAQQAWSGHLGTRTDGYTSTQFLVNGGFEKPLTGCLLDWRISPIDGAETSIAAGPARAGARSLCARFQGAVNLDYAGAVQSTYLPAGDWELSGWARTDGITTDRGIHLHLSAPPDGGAALDLATPSLTGTQDWTRLGVAFRLDAPRQVTVRVCRERSLRFDSKIAGAAWIDEVSLARPAR